MAVVVQCFEFDKALCDKLPDQKGPFPDVLSCQTSMWPAWTRVSPLSLREGRKMRDPGNEVALYWLQRGKSNLYSTSDK